MGIMARQRGEMYVISSDRTPGEIPTNRAPKRAADTYQVWTGDSWSTVMDDAQTFQTLDAADEYVRVNYARVVGPVVKKGFVGNQPAHNQSTDARGAAT